MTEPDRIRFREALRVWGRIGLLSFGGPAGQVALMHRELVERRKWIDEERFLHALNYCMLLPGPEAQQLATYIGWLLHRTRGGLAAGILFVLPSYFALLALAALYAGFAGLPLVAALFFGLKAAVLAVVVEAVLRIGRRALKNRLMVVLAAAAFAAIFFFEVPFPAIVLGAAVFGGFGRRLAPALFPAPPPASIDGAHDTVLDRMAARGELDHTRPSTRRAVLVALVSAVLLVLPVGALALAFGPSSVFVREGLFFAQAAFVTFGGAYAVLAYVAQQAVEVFHWLRPGEMLDGLGLAETTPGPLVMVVEFVGYLGAHRHPGALPPVLAGVLGATITVWVTFVPSFFFIFLGAPYVEALRGNRGIHAALSAVTASVVGVIVNLSLWFGLHVLFGEVNEHRVGPIRLLVPVLTTLDATALALTVFSMLAMFRFELGMPRTLAACAVLGAAARFLA